MSESSGAVTTGSGVVGVILEEPESTGGSGSRQQQAQAPERAGTLRCALWPRQQTWLCAVPLLIGFIGLGLSLMLLKWIVVGSVRDYVPTDLVDAKGIGQDPIFLSKPSSFPKGSDTTTTTTTTTSGPVGSSSPGITTSVRGKTRSGTPPNTSHRGGGASGSQVTQKSTTQRFGTRGPTFTTTTAFAITSSGRTSTSSPSPSNPTVLNDSTQMWTREQPSTERPVTTPARTHIHRKTPAPTLPPLKSEHFKPCQEKDLAYCLNDGECFVIETLSGPHKHCRCKEGFQGIRCDQFLPKTDSILSDPTDHLGIEFMESKEVYKRQVLSITCIAMGISFLGTLCMALYCRNKRRREKLQAHLKESRMLKNYSHSSSGLPCKSGLQLQNYCKSTRSCPPHGGFVHESSFAPNPTAASTHTKGLSSGRHHRSDSLSYSGEQRNNRSTLRLTSRRTPPIPRGRLNPIGGSRDSGPAYQHLREAEGSEREVEPGRVNTMKSDGDLHQDSFHNMQASYSPRSWGGYLDQGSLRSLCSGKSPPVPYRPCSIPIIPSVHSPQDEASCMQTATMNGSGQSSAPGGKPTGPGKQKEAVHLLEEAQAQLRALAHANKKQEDAAFTVPQGARETVCILLVSGGPNGGVAPSGPTETQLVNPRDPHKDSTQPSQ
ncbi:pro-neuregulin-3, membrane-bound isoform [Salminus brasiliensis]|uniref:pro-neuregulin-3, membrane-bound isoform n=1 Tax=Salminus brasiliensis TaxID=930266 RepID=UPI003B839AA2